MGKLVWCGLWIVAWVMLVLPSRAMAQTTWTPYVAPPSIYANIQGLGQVELPLFDFDRDGEDVPYNFVSYGSSEFYVVVSSFGSPEMSGARAGYAGTIAGVNVCQDLGEPGAGTWSGSGKGFDFGTFGRVGVNSSWVAAGGPSVPEPSSAGLAAVMAFFPGLIRWRR